MTVRVMDYFCTYSIIMTKSAQLPNRSVGCSTVIKFVLAPTSQSASIQVICRTDTRQFCGTAMVIHNKIGRMTQMLLAYICRTQALAWIFLKISKGMGSLSTFGNVMACGTKNGKSGMSIPTVLTQQRVFQKYSLFKHLVNPLALLADRI